MGIFCCNPDNTETKKRDYDENFKGPIQGKSRSCTDIICCLLFLCATVIFFLLGLVGWINGDPARLLNPVSSEGMVCKGNTPNLLMFDITACARISPTSIGQLTNGQCPTTSICVATCPTTMQVNIPGTANPATVICKTGVTFSTDPVVAAQQLVNEDCMAYQIESKPILHRCLPALNSSLIATLSASGANLGQALTTGAGQALQRYNPDGTQSNITPQELIKAVDMFNTYVLGSQKFFETAFEDLQNSYHWILYGLGIAILLSLIMMTLVKFIVGPVIYVLMLGIIGALGAGIWYSYTQWQDLLTAGATGTANSTITQSTAIVGAGLIQNADTWKHVFYACIVLIVVLSLIFIVVAGRLGIAIAVIGEASKAVWSMLFCILFPILTSLFVIGLVGYWAAVSIFLATSTDPLYNNTATGTPCTAADVGNANFTGTCVFTGYGGNKWYQVNQVELHILNLFLGLWTINFVLALSEMTMAGGFASWYWAFDKSKDIPTFPIAGALWRSLRYHIGTLAFGALIITIIQMIRICLEYVDSKLKGKENAFAKGVLCVLRCCLWCLEKCMKAINKRAYIVTAIYGYHFCKSAFEALGLLLRNALRTAVLSGVTFFVMWIGKLTVTIALGALSWAFFYGPLTSQLDDLQNTISANPNLNATIFTSIGNLNKPTMSYYWLPMALIIIGSYVIASLFFGVYSMSIDTIYICFLEDMERNDGSPERPYFATKNLMKVMGKSNKVNKDGKGGGKKRFCCC